MLPHELSSCERPVQLEKRREALPVEGASFYQGVLFDIEETIHCQKKDDAHSRTIVEIIRQ
jgi:hypothetical protein